MIRLIRTRRAAALAAVFAAVAAVVISVPLSASAGAPPKPVDQIETSMTISSSCTITVVGKWQGWTDDPTEVYNTMWMYGGTQSLNSPDSKLTARGARGSMRNTFYATPSATLHTFEATTTLMFGGSGHNTYPYTLVDAYCGEPISTTR